MVWRGNFERVNDVYEACSGGIRPCKGQDQGWRGRLWNKVDAKVDVLAQPQEIPGYPEMQLGERTLPGATNTPGTRGSGICGPAGSEPRCELRREQALGFRQGCLLANPLHITKVAVRGASPSRRALYAGTPSKTAKRHHRRWRESRAPSEHLSRRWRRTPSPDGKRKAASGRTAARRFSMKRT